VGEGEEGMTNEELATINGLRLQRDQKAARIEELEAALAEEKERWIQEREAWIRQKAECVGLEEKLAEAREDSERIQALYILAQVIAVPYIIIHLDLPKEADWDGVTCNWNRNIFNAAIDAARGAKP
jgi:hypothetical protein